MVQRPVRHVSAQHSPIFGRVAILRRRALHSGPESAPQRTDVQPTAAAATTLVQSHFCEDFFYKKQKMSLGYRAIHEYFEILNNRQNKFVGPVAVLEIISLAGPNLREYLRNSKKYGDCELESR